MKKVLVASALAHVAIFAALQSRPTTVIAPAASPPMAIEEVTIETETPEAPTEPTTATPTPTEPARVASVSTRGGGTGATTGGAVAPSASAGVATEPVAGGNTEWVVNLGPGVEARNFKGTQSPFVTRQQMEAEERAAMGPRKDNSLGRAMVAMDAAKGLGPDGPVLRALEEETRTSLAPVHGNATFRAIVDATGTVTGLSILDSSGDRAGWNDARDRAFAALQKKKLDLRAAKNGASIDIRVESELRYPSGAISRADLSAANGPSLAGDLSDLGSKPSRVVHARLSNITPL